MAGAGYKVFNAGDILTSSDVNTYLQQQVVMVFNDAAARTTALTSVLAEGMVTYLKDTNTVEVYDGSAWVSTAGDITGITAGTGITVTNPTSATPTVSIDTAVVPRLANANTFTATNTFNAAGTTAVDLIVRATASQTANLQEWQDSAGAIKARVDSGGAIYADSGLLTSATAHIGSFIANVKLNVNNNVAGNVGLLVRGAASQTANLQEWQNNSGTVLSRVASNGDIHSNAFLAPYLRAGGATVTNATALQVNGYGTSVPTVVVRAIASQTANLQEWQDSSGTRLTSIDSTGYLRVRNAPTGDFAASIGATYSGNIPLVLQGAASQTANLTEWRNSAGTVLARVNSDGIIISGTIQTSSALAQLSEENSGGRFRLTKATAAGSNPGTDVAKIYLRDGTNAGTLKLVVRAGSAGAETTVLDNIPQT